MKRVIHHLRKQSVETKSHILHAATALCGVVLVILWVYSLGSNFKKPETEVKVEENLKPFSVLKGNLALPQW